MIMGLETEKRLAQLLGKLADHETKIESMRMNLAEVYCFEPRTAFKRIDRNKNYSISAYEIVDFLRDNAIYITTNEAKTLVAAYDGDKDDRLDYKEFEKLVLPATDHSLKMRAYSRPEAYIGIRDKLHFEIEYQLSKLMKAEIDMLKDLNLQKSLLKERYDYSRYDSFKVVDTYKLNSLLRDDLRSFLNRNGVYATALDADSLLRRLDLDADGRITYSEFCDFLDQGDNIPKPNMTRSMSQSPSRANLRTSYSPEREERLTSTSPRKPTTDLKTKTNVYVFDRNSTPLRRNATPQKHSSVAKKQKQVSSFEDTPTPAKKEEDTPTQVQEVENTPTPVKEEEDNSSPVKNVEDTPQATKTVENTPPRKLQGKRLDMDDLEHQNDQKPVQGSSAKKRRASPMKGNEEDKLVDAIKELINIDMDLEKSKQTLSLKSDFNLFDAFRLFDKYNLGHIYITDLVDGLEKLGVYGPRGEINLFFKKYDKDCDGKLKYSEFFDAFCPKDRIYADHLNSKRANYQAKTPEEALSFQTRLDFSDMIRKHLRCEGQAESIRLRLIRSPLFSVSEAFEAIDSNNNGYLTKQEFASLLEEHEFFATNKELDLLFQRYDRDMDGKVTFSEFFTETVPKQAF